MSICYNKLQILMGVLLGLGFSLFMIYFDLTIPLTLQLLAIPAASLICGKIDRRLTCLAYCIPVIYFLSIFSRRIEHVLWIPLPYAKLIILVGILHMLEGMMTSMSCQYDHQPKIYYQQDHLIGGCHTYKKWFIPLFLLEFKSFYIPVLAILIYANDTFLTCVIRKTAYIGIFIFIYGLIVAGIGYLSLTSDFPLELAMVSMYIFHEILSNINTWLENKLMMKFDEEDKL